ncbi:MAG: hypothetical protein COA38_06640, partial [Fluviicola sp.]
MEIKELIDLAEKHLPQLKDRDGTIAVIQPIDQNATVILREVRLGPIKYNPLHIEPLLDEAFGHLVRCVDLRAVGQSMEERAIMDILNFENLFNSIEIEEKKLKLRKELPEGHKMIFKQSSLHRSSSKYLGTTDSIGKVAAYERAVLKYDEMCIEQLKNFNSMLKD